MIQLFSETPCNSVWVQSRSSRELRQPTWRTRVPYNITQGTLRRDQENLSEEGGVGSVFLSSCSLH